MDVEDVHLFDIDSEDVMEPYIKCNAKNICFCHGYYFFNRWPTKFSKEFSGRSVALITTIDEKIRFESLQSEINRAVAKIIVL